jgi:chromosome segregation ATPase
VPLPAYQSADSLLQAGGINVVRAVSLALETLNFEIAESRVMEITQQLGGFLDEFKVHRQSNTSPWLEARLRVRADSLDSALTKIRSLGNIRQETESSENTYAEKESLSAQLESKRAELALLNEILKHHSGSLSDTVAAEEKISERRNELNDLEKRWKKLESRVEYALVEIQVSEQYQARLDLRSAIISADIRNSLIEGVEGVIVSLGGVLSFILRYGLSLVIWLGILYWPSRTLWRRYRRAQSLGSLAGV